MSVRVSASGSAERPLPWVCLAGSRDLPAAWAPRVAAVARSVLAGGRGVAVGCAAGADAFALQAALAFPGVSAASLAVFAVGGPDGAGFWAASAYPLAARAALVAPGCVRWWAGGPVSRPLVARLVARSAAAVSLAAASGAGAGFVAFVTSPGSRGACRSARLAARLGLPVILFPCGFAPARLPALAAGRWAPVAEAGVWAGAWRWEAR